MRIGCALMLLAVMGLAGCKDRDASQSYVKDGKILIGEYASLTGGTADFGKSSHEGLMLAVKEINAAGGVKLGGGRMPIHIITEDDKSDQTEAINAVQKLISRDKVVAIIGEVASSRSMAGAQVCQKEKIPMLSPASTNPDVTKTGDYIFRICFTDAFQGPVLATFAQKQEWKRVAVITDIAQDYSKGLSGAFKQKFYADGGEIVAEENYKTDDPDFRAQLLKLKAANPDAVFLPGYYTEVGLILKQAREMDFDVPFFGGDGWDSSATLALPENIIKDCYFANHYSADDQREHVQAFVKKYEAEYNRTPDAMAILGYDAGRVMADAIERAGKVDPKAICNALTDTDNFPGASGFITMDKDRNAHKPLVIVAVENGKSVTKDTIEP